MPATIETVNYFNPFFLESLQETQFRFKLTNFLTLECCNRMKTLTNPNVIGDIWEHVNNACIYPTPSLQRKRDTRAMYKGSTADLNSELTLKVQSGLIWCEMPTVSFRIWTHVTKYISYDNHWTMQTSVWYNDL